MAHPPAQQRPGLDRRGVLRGLALTAAALALPPGRLEAAPLPLEQRLRVCQPPGDPLQELLRRNREFAAVWAEAEASGDPLERARLLQQGWPLHCAVRPDALARGQRPWAAVLACADSRVSPEWIFAAGPGELFEVRTAGNTASDAGVASLDFAVAELAVPLIVVLGHSDCGAVGAAMARQPLTPLLEELVLPIRAALPPGSSLAEAVAAHTRAAARDLPRRSAVLAGALEAGRLRIQPACLDIGSGRVSLL
ncbi:MAG: carbonic anhydrase [Synechococcaceae cyanobacterium ELA739]